MEELKKEHAKAPKTPKKRRRLKDPEAYQAEMEEDLKRTLEKHRQEIAEEAARIKPTDSDQEDQEEQPVTITEAPEPDAPDEAWIGDSEDPIRASEEKMKDPTEGIELKLGADLTMNQFFQKTLEMLKAATNAVTVLQGRSATQKHQMEIALSRIQHQKELEEAIGFKFARNGAWFTPRTNKCPKCGQYPTLQQEKGNRKRWLVICDHCWTRAESSDGPMQAIKNWNDGKETEISRMLNKPLDRT